MVLSCGIKKNTMIIIQVSMNKKMKTIKLEL